MVGKATKGSSFSGLAKYLTQDPERVAWTDTRRLFATGPGEVAREMDATAQAQPGRTEKPVYHLTLSFGRSDDLAQAQMQEAARRVLEDLGLSEHQALLVAHRDKEHPHMHVMVNLVHPETGQTWHTGHDYQRIEKTLRALEKEWGLERVPGHHARDPEDPAPDRSRSRTTAQIRIAREGGEPPFPDQVRRDVGRAFREARSWKELERRLKEHGYRIEAAGRGMVITDGERYARASSVDPEASRPRLEERFGQKLGEVGKESRYIEMFGPPAIKLSKEQRARQLEAMRNSQAQQAQARKTHEERYREMFGEPALKPETIREVRARRAARAQEAPARAAQDQTLPAAEHVTRQRAPGAIPAPDSRAAEGNERSGASYRAAGALGAAARPLSSEDGEREAVFRGLEVGLRLGAAFAARPAQEAKAAPAGYDGTPPPASPEVRQVMRTLSAYQEALEKEQALGAAIREHADLEGKLKGAGKEERYLAAYERDFDKHLARTYQDPPAAKERFLKAAKEQGASVAREQMRQAPEHFGKAREVRRSKWLGLATEIEKVSSYRAALSAAEYGGYYVRSRAALPNAAQRSAWEAALTAKKSEIEGLQRALRGPGSPSRLLRRLSGELRALPPGRQAELKHFVSPGGMKVVRRALQKGIEAARGRGR